MLVLFLSSSLIGETVFSVLFFFFSGIYLCLISHHSVCKCSKEPVYPQVIPGICSCGISWRIQLPSVWGYKFSLCIKAGVGMRRKGAKGLTFIECLLHASHRPDSFTYSVLWARCCSHVIGKRLWEVQRFVQGHMANVWPSLILSHAFLRGFLLHLASWTFLPTSLRYLYFPLAFSLRTGLPHLSPMCYTVTQTQLKKHKPYNNITEFDCIRIKNFYSEGYHDKSC